MVETDFDASLLMSKIILIGGSLRIVDASAMHKVPGLDAGQVKGDSGSHAYDLNRPFWSGPVQTSSNS